MYSIIEKCYGILLQDEANPVVSKHRLALLRKLMELDSPEYLRDDPDDPNSPPMSDQDFEKYFDEIIDGSPYIWSAYSGGGVRPLVLGFGIDSVAAFEVGKDVNFFITSDAERQQYWVKFEQLFQTCPNRVEMLSLIREHQLDVIFTHSTS